MNQQQIAHVEMDCEQMFHQAWARFTVRSEQIAMIYSRLDQAYAQSQRSYHNWHHIRGMLFTLMQMQNLTQNFDALTLAVFYHDLVCESGRSDNEARSAEAFVDDARLIGADPRFVEATVKLIFATRHDQPIVDNDQQLIVDLDLIELAASDAVFDENSRRVLAELGATNDAEMLLKQRAFMRSLLERRSIFQHPAVRQRFEAKARENVVRYLQKY